MNLTCRRCGLTGAAVQQTRRGPRHLQVRDCVDQLQLELAAHQEVMVWLAGKLAGRKWDEVVPGTVLLDAEDVPVRFIRADDFWAWAAELMRWEADRVHGA